MKNIYHEKTHSFVICAYNDSPFLIECIDSLMKQTIQSQIILTTSTPSGYIEDIARKYNIELFINYKGGSIARDWNFAISKAKTDIVTIAHQDDMYEPCYTEEVLRKLYNREKALIVFTNYGELREGVKTTRNRLLVIKRIMLLPFHIKWMQENKWIRRRILSFGSAISCPTVSYIKNNLPKDIFKEGYRSDLDWQAWERLSLLDGAFIYCNKICMYHRIHDGSATTEIIADHRRSVEDFEMFCKFWPETIAKLITRIYRRSENSNNL